MLRILMLATDAYGGHGGIAYYNRCLVEALCEIQEVDEIVLIPRVARFALEGVPARVRIVSSALGSKVNFLRAVARLMFKKFDVVLCGHVNLLPVAAAISLIRRTPLVLQVHGVDVWHSQPLLSRVCLRLVQSIWSVSSFTRDEMNKWAHLPLNRYTLIPNTIRLELYGMAAPRLDLIERYGLSGRKVILSLARLSAAEKYKGVDEIIEAMPLIHRTEPSVVFLILGDGDDLDRLRAKAFSLGLSDMVIFAGYVDEGEKADHLRLGDVLAMPGRGEGFGVVFLEALACGVPVVGSIADGSRDALLGGRLGGLADPDDLESIASKILEAIALRKAIPADLHEFAWPSFSSRVADAIRGVVRSRRR